MATKIELINQTVVFSGDKNVFIPGQHLRLKTDSSRTFTFIDKDINLSFTLDYADCVDNNSNPFGRWADFKNYLLTLIL